MKNRVYVIYDKIAEEGGPLFCAKNDGVASRNMRNLFASQKVDNPKDYQLMCLGEYDPDQPSLFDFAVPEFVKFDFEEEDE